MMLLNVRGNVPVTLSFMAKINAFHNEFIKTLHGHHEIHLKDRYIVDAKNTTITMWGELLHNGFILKLAIC